MQIDPVILDKMKLSHLLPLILAVSAQPTNFLARENSNSESWSPIQSRGGGEQDLSLNGERRQYGTQDQEDSGQPSKRDDPNNDPVSEEVSSEEYGPNSDSNEESGVAGRIINGEEAENDEDGKEDNKVNQVQHLVWTVTEPTWRNVSWSISEMLPMCRDVIALLGGMYMYTHIHVYSVYRLD